MDRKTLDAISGFLPKRVYRALCGNIKDNVTEIRLRSGLPVTLTVDGENVFVADNGEICTSSGLAMTLTPAEIRECVNSLCRGSVYSYSESLREGYVSYDGMRIGIVGKAVTENGICDGFSEYRSINIRLPRHIENADNALFSEICRVGAASFGGILVISPPGLGKTTFLRSLAKHLSFMHTECGKTKAYRVCLIDEREEFLCGNTFEGCAVDIISRLSKGKAIEIATRTMSPEYIFCDEIGSVSDAGEILMGHTGGITFASSCHAVSLEDAARREHIAKLFSAGVFSTACILGKASGKHICEIKRIKHD